LLLAAIALAACGAPQRLTSAPLALRIGLAMLAFALAVIAWDDQTSFERALATDQRQTGLEQLMPDHGGEVLWLLGTNESWLWLGRPNWNSPVQGARMLFSRDLAYAERARVRVAADLAPGELNGGFARKVSTVLRDLPAAGVRTICARPDAPAYIVAPVTGPGPQLDAMRARYWRGPMQIVPLQAEGGSAPHFERIDTYAVIDCAEQR
jgi:hypothetical protein